MLTGLTDGQVVDDYAKIVEGLAAQLAAGRGSPQHALAIGSRIDAVRSKTEDTKALARSLLEIAAGRHS